MSDIIDTANDLAALMTENALKNIKQESIIFTGKCHYCDESVHDGLRFCDSDCRDDWQKEQAAIERRGQIRGME